MVALPAVHMQLSASWLQLVIQQAVLCAGDLPSVALHLPACALHQGGRQGARHGELRLSLPWIIAAYHLLLTVHLSEVCVLV